MIIQGLYEKDPDCMQLEFFALRAKNHIKRDSKMPNLKDLI